MTTVYYRLADGREVLTLKEAKDSGLTYTVIHKEELHRDTFEVHEPTPKQLESRAKRWEKMTAHFTE